MSRPHKLTISLVGPGSVTSRRAMYEAMAKLLRDEGYEVVSPRERADEVSRGRDFWSEVDRQLLLPKLRAELTRRRAERGAAPEHGTHDFAVAGELDELLAWLESDEAKP